MPITVTTWNINSVRLRINLVAKFLKAARPDVLCLQETKAEKGQAEIDLPGYHEYWNSAEKKGYSGTAIFCKAKSSSRASLLR